MSLCHDLGCVRFPCGSLACDTHASLLNLSQMSQLSSEVEVVVVPLIDW